MASSGMMAKEFCRPAMLKVLEPEVSTISREKCWGKCRQETFCSQRRCLMDFIADGENIVPLAQLQKAGQLLLPPDAAHRVVGGAQKQHLDDWV